MIAGRTKGVLFGLVAAVIIITGPLLLNTIKGTPKPVNGETAPSETVTATDREISKDSLLQELKTKLPDGGIIKASYADDFDKDGKFEIFGLVKMGKDSTEDTSANQVWYVNQFGASRLLDGGIYPDSAGVWDVGRQMLFHVEEGYGGSGSSSHVWSVKKGVPYELNHAGESLSYEGNLNFYTYPGEFDLMTDGTGHTWKRYYLYFEETTGTFREYGGISISKENFLKLKGASKIYDEIVENGYNVSDIFYRENGIININYNNQEYNLNITLTVMDGAVSISEKSGSIKNPDLDRGGIYKAAFFKDIATYPENFDSVLKDNQGKSPAAGKSHLDKGWLF